MQEQLQVSHAPCGHSQVSRTFSTKGSSLGVGAGEWQQFYELVQGEGSSLGSFCKGNAADLRVLLWEEVVLGGT